MVPLKLFRLIARTKSYASSHSLMLTRRSELQNNHVLPQLVFHGKKTVPAALRRDLWTPYFSIKLPSSHSGLLAYHQLRELSLQRQLAAPDDLITTTRQKATTEMRSRMTLEEELTWDKEHEGQNHPDGKARTLNRKDRAKVLMMQRATSVADVAFVLETIAREGHLLAPSSVQKLSEERREGKLLGASKRKARMLKVRWKLEQKKEHRYENLRTMAQQGTKWGLEKYAAKRIATEHGGIIVDPFIGRARVLLPGRDDKGHKSEQPSEQPSHQPGHESDLPIRVLWADMRDSAYAARWPDFVSHGELDRMAVSRRARGPTDPLGPVLSNFVDRSIHVMGDMKTGDDAWMRGHSFEPVDAVGKDDAGQVTAVDPQGASFPTSTPSLPPPPSASVPASASSGPLNWVRSRLGLGA
jgi:hypothetical protein